MGTLPYERIYRNYYDEHASFMKLIQGLHSLFWMNILCAELISFNIGCPVFYKYWRCFYYPVSGIFCAKKWDTEDVSYMWSA